MVVGEGAGFHGGNAGIAKRIEELGGRPMPQKARKRRVRISSVIIRDDPGFKNVLAAGEKGPLILSFSREGRRNAFRPSQRYPLSPCGIGLG